MEDLDLRLRAVKPRVAIVGAGWAGLAAAVTLAEQAELTVFEAGREPGGRARRVVLDDALLDNGQHILIGAYNECLALMRTVGVDPRKAFLRLPLTWQMVGGVRMRCPRLPAPLHVAVGLLTARGLSLAEKRRLAAALDGLKRANWRVQPDRPVATWLRETGQNGALTDSFWKPLVLSAMNTPLHLASTATLARVLADSLGGRRAASDLLLPRIDLSELFPLPAWRWLAKRGATLYEGCRVRSIVPDGVGVRVDGRPFDAVIVATAPYHAEPLLEFAPDAQRAIQTLRFEPIYTVYLRYARAPRLPSVMTGLAGGMAHWLFERGALTGEEGLVAAVISAASNLADWPRQSVIDKVAADIAKLDPSLGAPLWSRMVVEKRATFAASVDRQQIKPRLNGIQYGYLAGDWLDPSYPATLEGAAKSGLAAARALMQEWTRQR
ncbi:hydroxysqualene dehydroxylase HpnE [Crenobacter sp. SG2303]|uniref:Hydroxysqualene dehydroxylase HpnE n=1 Tax=Crenobacter oryzisoli TaxID=3056844 RepID=A0ABT7XQT8_9NEIS|nr:hydroxysqualene dehydroxylase HpnE [Crenobacter sp. SG2303]MDN0076173.1 hydroxysqualene dehydroxylase HpnE [Crenobacter sp. SG2303]